MAKEPELSHQMKTIPRKSKNKKVLLKEARWKHDEYEYQANWVKHFNKLVSSISAVLCFNLRKASLNPTETPE